MNRIKRSAIAVVSVSLAAVIGVLAFKAPAVTPAPAPTRAPWTGVDCNYERDMSSRNKTWKDGSGPVDPLALFARHGCQNARIRLWVGDDGMNRLTYATQTARLAQRAGLKPYLVIFLSEEWADFVKQPAPAVWKDLSPEKKLAAIEAYAESVVRHMARNGIDLDTFEIGNEIDFGVCGEFEEEWPHRVSVEFMRQKVWPRMVPILKAAEAGVLKAQPKAKFVLHLSQWNNVEYCIAFWQAMLAAGVRIDYPGISYFPSSAEKAEERSLKYLSAQAGKIVAALGKPVLICETGYPAAARFGGQFAAWNHPAEGYPLSDAGQAKWIADFIAVVRGDPNFAGAFYWSPEWYDGGLWDAFALFDANGVARPGVRSFQVPAASSPAGTRPTLEQIVGRYSRQEIFCLDVGDEHRFKLKDGSARSIRLVSVAEQRDSVIKRMRRAEIDVTIDGKPVKLACAPYVMPSIIDGLRLQADTTSGWTRLPGRVQFSAWDASDPIVDTAVFGYPIRNYRLFSHGMQAFNEVVHLGRGDGDPDGQKFYHDYGVDTAGAEGVEEIVSATDAEVISFWPSREKLCSVVTQDANGLTWEYAHLASVEPEVVIGKHLKRGDKIGVLGKTGPSGNFSHLHLGSFVSRADMESDRPCRRLNLYPWLVAAYHAAHPKPLYAVARPHHTALTGEKVILESNSFSFDNRIVSWQWTLPDGRTVNGPRAEATFDAGGAYMAMLRVKDDKGHEDVDFCQIKVFSAAKPEARMPTIFMTCTPTENARVGQNIVFRMWFQGASDATLDVDFGDGSVLAGCKPYENVGHAYSRAGTYIVAARCRADSRPATCMMKVIVWE